MATRKPTRSVSIFRRKLRDGRLAGDPSVHGDENKYPRCAVPLAFLAAAAQRSRIVRSASSSGHRSSCRSLRSPRAASDANVKPTRWSDSSPSFFAAYEIMRSLAFPESSASHREIGCSSFENPFYRVCMHPYTWNVIAVFVK
jgi:hypothetical protein